MSGATYGFYDPGAIAAKGEYVWVANVGGSCDACNFPGEGTTITVINSSNGALVKVLGDWSYEFDGPSAFTFEGRQLWVANSAGNTVTVVPVH
jgi:DNA-binding beta-propeller fold protein YncE